MARFPFPRPLASTPSVKWALEKLAVQHTESRQEENLTEGPVRTAPSGQAVATQAGVAKDPAELSQYLPWELIVLAPAVEESPFAPTKCAKFGARGRLFSRWPHRQSPHAHKSLSLSLFCVRALLNMLSHQFQAAASSPSLLTHGTTLTFLQFVFHVFVVSAGCPTPFSRVVMVTDPQPPVFVLLWWRGYSWFRSTGPGCMLVRRRIIWFEIIDVWVSWCCWESLRSFFERTATPSGHNSSLTVLSQFLRRFFL
jgi:hypothetical protein